MSILRRNSTPRSTAIKYKDKPHGVKEFPKPEYNLPNGRNKRCVWQLSTEPYPDAHFATYPEKLCETPIKAGCPSHICKKCGKAREKILEPSEEYKKYLGGKGFGNKDWLKTGGGNQKSKNYPSLTADYRLKGYTDCGCNAGFRPGVVMDPFAGSFTTLKVARELGRKGIGIELNEDYIKMGIKRMNLNQALFEFK